MNNRSYHRGTRKEELVVFIIFLCVLIPTELAVFTLLGIRS